MKDSQELVHAIQSPFSSGSEWSHGDERAEVNSESIVYIKSGE